MNEDVPGPDQQSEPVMVAENWKDTLPEDLKSEPILSRFNDVPAMAKALVSAQKMVGADKVAVPSAGDAEGWDTVYDRLGRPKSPDGYELNTPDNLPSEFITDDTMIGKFREEAHRLGLSSKQTTSLYQWFLTTEGERFVDVKNRIDTLRTQGETELRREWAGQYDAKLAHANEAARALLGDSGTRELREKGYSSDPVIMRLLAAVGERVVEGQVDGEGPRSMGRSPAEARGEISRLQGDREFSVAYQDRSHPDHASAVARMSGLYEQAYPGGGDNQA